MPGIGFALGVDRILIARREPDDREGPLRAYVVVLGDAARAEALPLATRLRRAGVATGLDLGGRGMKGQMKDASRSGARYAVIIGDDELAAGVATVKDLDGGDQERCKLEDLHGRLSR